MNFRLPRFQFSLRTLVIFMIIVAVCASWHGSRYARFHARVTAKAELEKMGFHLAEPQDQNWITTEKRQDDSSWLVRWDRYWFGEEAVREYTLLMIAKNDFFRQQVNQPTFDYARLLNCFPELQGVDVRYGSLTTLAPDINVRPLPSELILAIARLPNLEQLAVYERGVFDDAWVAALPEPAALHALGVAELTVTPAGSSLLFQKCPKLCRLRLPSTAIDANVVKQINQLVAKLEANPDQQSAGTDRGGVLIDLVDPRGDPATNLPPELSQLAPQVRLNFQQTLTEEIKNLKELQPLTKRPLLHLSNYAFHSLDAWRTGSLRFDHWPNVTWARFVRSAAIEIDHCEQLRFLDCSDSDQVKIHDHPQLESLMMRGCGRVEVQDCPRFQKLDATFSTNELLVLKNLPALTALNFEGKELELVNIPQLVTVTLRNPQEQLFRALRELPALENLILDYGYPAQGASYKPGSLLLLRDVPTLRRLSISGEAPLGSEFFRDLQELTNLRVLRLEQLHSNAFPNFFGPLSRERRLPPKLELLTAPDHWQNYGDIATPLREKFPRLVYVTPSGSRTFAEDPDGDGALAALFKTSLAETPPAETWRPWNAKTAKEIEAIREILDAPENAANAAINEALQALGIDVDPFAN